MLAITADRTRGVRTRLTEEYGLPHQLRSPWRAAAGTFAAFLLAGLVPLLPFLVSMPGAFPVAAACTAVVFFAIGSLKSRWSVRRWWLSGLETLLVGSGAAAVAYAVGALLRGFA